MRFKCHTCKSIVDTDPKKPCPSCGDNHLEKMCSEDHLCTCAVEISDGARYCETCGQPVCACGSHDVVVISRVTGYLSDVDGWNKAKRQELKDRVRYTAGLN